MLFQACHPPASGIACSVLCRANRALLADKGPSAAGFPDLANMATLLGNLGRLGYMLAGDPVSAGSKSTSEMDPEDRGSSGKSTPTNLHSYHQQYAGLGLPAGALESFPLQLSLGHSAERSQYAANQPAVLAGYGLNRTAVSPLICWQADQPRLSLPPACLSACLPLPACTRLPTRAMLQPNLPFALQDGLVQCN